MSRPQLKLPKKSIDRDTKPGLDTPTSPLMPSHVAGTSASSTSSPSPTITTVAPSSISADAKNVSLSVEKIRLEHIATRILGRFRPVSKDWFYTYAKALRRVTNEPLNRSRETLAKIYQYANLNEIVQELLQPGDAGPFDEDISDDDWETDIVQAALVERNKRTIEIIKSRNPAIAQDRNNLLTSDGIYYLGLFNTPPMHRIALSELGLPK
ncbi:MULTISPECIES: hypothetical protein [unclassified Massilia]|uniref:hypothetical protein n=1 Tax=unclassified Massilia TaxID=2609279 RepID=UPI000AC430BC|nr:MULTISPECIES: hypothetical protein [unclassified Massilia]